LPSADGRKKRYAKITRLLELHILTPLKKASITKSNIANHLQFVPIAPSTAFQRLKKSSQPNKNILPSKSQYAENILLLSVL